MSSSTADDWRTTASAHQKVIPSRPTVVQSRINKLNSKTSAVTVIDVPNVLRAIDTNKGNSKTGDNDKYTIVKPQHTVNHKSHAAIINNNSIKYKLVYDIPTLSDSALYDSTSTVLPELELFDSYAVTDEHKLYLRTDGQHVPASALYYGGDKNWTWRDCIVTCYNESTSTYTVQFDRPVQVKQVKRLSVQFGSENAQAFRQRLEKCTAIREGALAAKRYMSFIECQSDLLYTPINHSLLHGIVNNLMAHSQSLVVDHQSTVENMLASVRLRYGRALKYSVIELIRRNLSEQQHLSHLRLPPAIQSPSASYCAAVNVYRGVHTNQYKQIQQTIRTKHIFYNLEATSVLLAWQRAYSQCTADMTLLDCTVKRSMSLYDYMEHQERHLKIAVDKLQADWRGYLINLIRDNLNSVFKLFVNDMTEYNDSQLSAFLRLITYMSRHQLQTVVQQSILSYEALINTYNSEDVCMNHRPMFAFKLSVDTHANTVTFIPALATVVEHIGRLIDIPSKLQALLHSIDNDVVPLLGLSDRPILSPDSAAQLFDLTHRVQHHVRAVVQKCVDRPQELANTFEQYNWIIQCNAESFAESLFETTNLGIDHVDVSVGKDAHSDINSGTSDLKRVGGTDFALIRSPAIRPVHVSQYRLKRTVGEICNEIEKFRESIHTIQSMSTNTHYYPLLSIDTAPVRDQLINKAKSIVNTLLIALQQNMHSCMSELLRSHEQIIGRINKKSTTVAELAELKAYVQHTEQHEMANIRAGICDVTAKFDVTQRFNCVCNNDILTTYWHIQQLPRLITEAIHTANVDILNDNVKFQKLLKQEQYEFNCNLIEYSREVNQFSEFGIATSAIMESYATRIEQLNEKLEKADLAIQSFQQREHLFNVPVITQYAELDNIRNKFQPYFELWSVVSLFNGNHSMWTTGSFVELDPPAMTRDVNAWITQTQRLELHFVAENCVKPLALAQDIKAKINEFMQYLPVIHNLRLPTLRPRHWDKLSQLLSKSDKQQQSLIVDSELTLGQLIGYQPLQFAAEIDIVARTSSYEFTLEQQLDAMLKQWQTTTLNLQQHEQYSQQYILVNAVEILDTLSDQLKQTTNMRTDAYIKYFEIRTRKWENRLSLTQQIMTEWIAVQSLYFALRVIFADDADCKKVPVEGRRYNVIQQYYSQIAQAALKNKSIIDFVADTDNLLKTLKECHKMLDMVAKQLPTDLMSKHSLGNVLDTINNQFTVNTAGQHRIAPITTLTSLT